MKRTVVTAGVLGLLGVSSAFAEDAKIAAKTDRVSLFEVALRCEAAPEIGCGSRSKPVLLELEREPIITEAWLNETGTVLAVVGTEGSSHDSRSEIVQSILEKNGVTASDPTNKREQIIEELSAIAHQTLDEREVAAFKEAMARGVRPLPDDKEEPKTETTAPDCCSPKSAAQS
jgi:hypothetical protein